MSAFTLRLIACLAMLIDHIGYQYDIPIFRLVGRIAFPIFVFLLVNGIKHTSSVQRYALRLGVFAILSQIPFSLFTYGVLWDASGNVFFTLFLALGVLIAMEQLSQFPLLRWMPAVCLVLCYEFGLLSSTYGARGIILALIFYFAYDQCSGWPLFMGLGLILTALYPALTGYFHSGVLQVTQWDLRQMFSLFSLPFLCSYNGQKGGPSLQSRFLERLLQYGFYAFYPVHQLVLWLL